jgi:SPP1 family predicted phage head-tail adaptor
MRAGRLRHRVTIQQRAGTQDSYGQEDDDWNDVDTVWAAVEPLRGREFLEARREGAEVTTRIVTRYRSGITPAMRVSYDSRTFDIVSVINVDERDSELQLMCRELVTT